MCRSLVVQIVRTSSALRPDRLPQGSDERCVVRVTCKYLDTPQRHACDYRGLAGRRRQLRQDLTRWRTGELRWERLILQSALKAVSALTIYVLPPVKLLACDRNTVVVILIGTNDALASVTRATLRANVDALSQLRRRTSRWRACRHCVPQRRSGLNATRTSWPATSALTCFRLCALIWRCRASTAERTGQLACRLETTCIRAWLVMRRC